MGLGNGFLLIEFKKAVLLWMEELAFAGSISWCSRHCQMWLKSDKTRVEVTISLIAKTNPIDRTQSLYVRSINSFLHHIQSIFLQLTTNIMIMVSLDALKSPQNEAKEVHRDGFPPAIPAVNARYQVPSQTRSIIQPRTTKRIRQKNPHDSR
jgi:hypothetical protein